MPLQLDGYLAGAELGRNLFVKQTGDDQLHYFTLAGRQQMVTLTHLSQFGRFQSGRI